MRRFGYPAVALAAITLLGLLPLGCGGGDDGPTDPGETTCLVDVYFPTAGREWQTGEDLTVRWNGSSGEVDLFLLKGGTAVGTMAASWPNQKLGSMPWTVTSFGLSTDDDYAVRVVSTTDAACADTSDAFTIVNIDGCSITIVNPDSSRVVAGQTMDIAWSSENTTGLVDIELRWNTVEDMLAGVIAEGVANDGAYSWVIDSFHLGTLATYNVVIRDATLPTCYGRSPYFQITDEEICEIFIYTPGKGQVLTNGQSFNVTFETLNGSGNVDIELWVNFLSRQDIVAEGVPAVDGAYLWASVDDNGYDGPVDDSFRLKILDAADGYCLGWSEKFAIRDP